MTFKKILIKEDDMRKIQLLLEQMLNIEFQKRESSYWGEYCICKNLKTMKSMEIKYNYIDEDWQYEELKNCPIIIYLNETLEEDDCFQKILLEVHSVERVFIIEVKPNIYYRKYIYQDGQKELIWEKVY